jgi:hypothetical protein
MEALLLLVNDNHEEALEVVEMMCYRGYKLRDYISKQLDDATVRQMLVYCERREGTPLVPGVSKRDKESATKWLVEHWDYVQHLVGTTMKKLPPPDSESWRSILSRATELQLGVQIEDGYIVSYCQDW